MVTCDWWHDYKGLLIDENTIYDYVGQDKHVVVDFFTPWCHYCQVMAPDYGEVYTYYHDNPSTRKDVIIAQLNCQTNQNFCARLGVNSYPRVYYFRPNDKNIANGFNGMRRYEQIKEFVQNWAGPEPPKKVVDNSAHIQENELEEKERNLKRLQEQQRIREIELDNARAEELRIAREMEQKRRREQEEDRIRRQREQQMKEELEAIRENQLKILQQQAEQQAAAEIANANENQGQKNQNSLGDKNVGDDAVNYDAQSIEGKLEILLNQVSILKDSVHVLQNQTDNSMQSLGNQIHYITDDLQNVLRSANTNFQNNNQSGGDSHNSINWTHAVVFVITGSLLGVILGFILKPSESF